MIYPVRISLTCLLFLHSPGAVRDCSQQFAMRDPIHAPAMWAGRIVMAKMLSFQFIQDIQDDIFGQCIRPVTV
jgi:hypothetical protein